MRRSSSLRRSASHPALSDGLPPRPPARAALPAFLSDLRRRAATLRRPRARRPSDAPPAPSRAPPASPSSFGDYVRAEMKPPADASAASPHLPDAHVVATDGPLLLPFARRNLHLRFLQIDTTGEYVQRVATRQEILSEVRQNWDADPADARNRLPRRSPPARTRRRDDAGDSVAARRARSGRPRNAGRGERARPPVSWALPPGTSMAEIRSAGCRLTVRDMRQIDPAFTAKPAIWVREDAILVSMEDVRAIILHSKMFVFDPENTKVQAPIWYIRKRLMNLREDIFMPFEFVALEGILIHTCLVLEREFHAIEPQLLRILRDLPNKINHEQLERLRQQEQRLNQYYSRSRKVQAVLQSVLDEDEDMADMYLTEKRRNPGVMRNPVDHDEAEMLLETYMQTVDDLTSRAGLLTQAIDDAENLIEIHLDTTQNRLLLVDLIITVITTILSFGTMITAMFGMNFPLPADMQQLPRSQYYFAGCVVVMLLVMSVGLVVLTRWCRTQGIYSGRPHNSRKKRPVPGPAALASEETWLRAEDLLNKPHRPVAPAFRRDSNVEDWGELPT